MSIFIRGVLTALLLFGIWEDSKICLVVSLALIMIAIELHGSILSVILKRLNKLIERLERELSDE